MANENAAKFQFRLDNAVVDVLKLLSLREGYELTAYMQKILTRHAVESKLMKPDQEERIRTTEEVIQNFIKLSKKLFAAGRFDAHFQRTVFAEAMDDEGLRRKYETAVGGNAFESGLPGKTPLNMYLGWYIKNAIGADAQMKDGKPVRTSVRNAPIQSYTLLQEPAQSLDRKSGVKKKAA